MSATRGLVVAIDVAQRRRDDASAELVQVQGRQAHAQLQMEQLQSYAGDTESRWSVAAQQSATPQIVGHYVQFMERLWQTIDLQKGVIADLQRQCDCARGLLLEADIRVAGLKRLLENRRLAQSRVEARREQKSSDEFASRQMRRVAADSETWSRS